MEWSLFYLDWCDVVIRSPWETTESENKERGAQGQALAGAPGRLNRIVLYINREFPSSFCFICIEVFST